ncbi:MAG: hypothetical protein IJS29_09375 [Selenomonadaceae bacterium]|nr:hypothetical protein [Selenomonadaceae bacterium]
MFLIFCTAEDKNKIESSISRLKAEVAALKGELDAIKRQPDSTAELKAQLATLKGELDAIKRQPDSTVELKAELATLKGKLESQPDFTAELQTQLETYKAAITNQLREMFQVQIDALKKENDTLKDEVDALKRQPDSTVELKAQLATLKGELDAIKKENAALKDEVDKLKQQISNPTTPPTSPTPPTPPTPDEKIFYLKPNDAAFISNDIEKIPAQIAKALNVDDMKNFLIANDSETSKKFQKLLNVHFKAVKSFADKLKLKDLDDEELSETVTSKYFKLFQQIIFDNLLLAIQRGVKTSDDFYAEFLAKLNAYLEQCGIYSVNVKAGVKATDDDYKNMSLQNVKTSNKNLAGVINQIERLPYRINYLDEFGEQKFFQYNGMMSLYKAV